MTVGRKAVVPAPSTRVLSRQQCVDIAHRVFALTVGGGPTDVAVSSHWTGSVRFANNKITTSGDTLVYQVSVNRSPSDHDGTAVVNRIDDASLAAAVAGAERAAIYSRPQPDALAPIGPQDYEHPDLWSDATFDLDARGRADAVRRLVDPAVAAGVDGAGYLEVGATAQAVINSTGREAYQAWTRAQYSVTARTRDGTRSGWAGQSAHDWTRIDAGALSARALTNCLRSARPVAIEPGRYTVILEPQAVGGLLYVLFSANDFVRPSAEAQIGVFSGGGDQSKLGQRVFDERLTIVSDPADKEFGFAPFDESGEPMHRTAWVERGVLRQLAYDRSYAVSRLGLPLPQPKTQNVRVEAGSGTLDDLIAGTARGLLVARFGNLQLVGEPMLITGTTRDGLWLIEHGKIVTAVKNMRFLDSPISAFNAVEQVGAPTVGTFGLVTIGAPPMRIRDFNFTSLTDAV